MSLRDTHSRRPRGGVGPLCLLLALGSLCSCDLGGVTGSRGGVAIYPRFAYVTAFNNHTVSMYTVDAATGQLRHNGYVARETLASKASVRVGGAAAFAL
jgi:hypothetical protein